MTLINFISITFGSIFHAKLSLFFAYALGVFDSIKNNSADFHLNIFLNWKKENNFLREINELFYELERKSVILQNTFLSVHPLKNLLL